MLTDYIIYGRTPGEAKFKVVENNGAVSYRLNHLDNAATIGGCTTITIHWDNEIDHALKLVAQVAAMEAVNPGWEFDLRVME